MKKPSEKSSRSGSVLNLCAAIFFAFATIFPIAMCTAVPPTTRPRLPKVPTPCVTTSVSPCTTVTSSSPMPKASATICAKAVSWPCPCGDTPVITVTAPVGSTRSSALSHVPRRSSTEAPVDGPSPQISVKVATPRPTSSPAARRRSRSACAFVQSKRSSAFASAA